MKDLNGVVLAYGMIVQFDDDYFGHGMQRELLLDCDGNIGFESIPGNSGTFCYVEDWLDEIEVVDENTKVRTKGKVIKLNGKSHQI